jgi:hypothetical protein
LWYRWLNGVKQLVLGLLLLRQELDVVEQQNVHVPVLPGELIPAAVPDGADELAHERLGGDVAASGPRREPPHVVRHGEQQVRLAQTHAP